jgi:hypothetical protein
MKPDLTVLEQSTVPLKSILVVLMVRAWGDMGTQGLSCTLGAALAVAASGKLAVATGAFPSTRARVRSQRLKAPPVVTLGTPGWSRPLAE